jgi:hypothetical protein
MMHHEPGIKIEILQGQIPFCVPPYTASLRKTPGRPGGCDISSRQRVLGVPSLANSVKADIRRYAVRGGTNVSIWRFPSNDARDEQQWDSCLATEILKAGVSWTSLPSYDRTSIK